MKSEGWSDSEAFEFVKTKRPVICPNEGFIEQLRLYSGILTAKLAFFVSTLMLFEAHC